jgi:cholesterol transport system auxiliary component
MIALGATRRYWWRIANGVLATLVCGCTALQPTTGPLPIYLSLDGPTSIVRSGSGRITTSQSTLVVNPPGAFAGFDSQRIAYARRAHELEYFAHHLWIDTPARMLGPLIVVAIERSNAFRAVVQAPSIASGEMRLDTEIVRLQHEFLQQPSRVHFTLRATLVDSSSRRVLQTREFDAYATAPSEDPYGGVLAAQQAVGSVVKELAAFCADVLMQEGKGGAVIPAPHREQ